MMGAHGVVPGLANVDPKATSGSGTRPSAATGPRPAPSRSASAGSSRSSGSRLAASAAAPPASAASRPRCAASASSTPTSWPGRSAPLNDERGRAGVDAILRAVGLLAEMNAMATGADPSSTSRACAPSSACAAARSPPSTTSTSSIRPGETRGARRRVGLGQVGDQPLGHAASCRARSASIAAGRMLFRGKDGQPRDLVALDEEAMRRIRGNDIGMVFQEPMTSLNPVYTIGDQIAEPIRIHRGTAQRAAADAAVAPPRQGRHPRPAPPRRPVPARALRRHAPARHHRHGARLRPGAAHRRRADHRARRDHPGADPRPAADAAARTRHGHALRHPQPRRRRRDRRPRRGDVRRPHRRRPARSRRSSPTRATPTPSA